MKLKALTDARTQLIPSSLVVQQDPTLSAAGKKCPWFPQENDETDRFENVTGIIESQRLIEIAGEQIGKSVFQ